MACNLAIYQFKSDDGEVIERSIPMRQAPAIGSVLLHDGKTYRRIISAPPVSGAAPGLAGEYDSNAYPKLSAAASQFSPGADYCKEPGRHYGKPIITSKSHEREFCRINGLTREYSS